MTISPVSSGVGVQYGPGAKGNQIHNAPKHAVQVPQDSVDISSAARAKQGQSAGDVDHDGDSH